MDVSTFANLINAFAVTAGVIFAAAQIRYYRQRRRRDAMLELVDDFFSGPILLSWQKLRVWAEEWRHSLNRETGSEWFHWLAERMMEREKLAPPVPAYVAHRTWRETRRHLARDGSPES